MLFFRALVSAFFILQAAALATDKATRDQQPILPDSRNSENQTYKLLVDEGFYFGNPSTDCKYASQPYIYSEYKRWSEDNTHIVSMLTSDVDFTIVGHHPVSGHYHDFKHFYVNAFWRIGTCITEVYPELFKITLLQIHGGCNEEWSVQEVRFEGKANNGMDFELINVWVTRWRDGKIHQVRTYIDAQETTLLLYQNENWTNSTTHTDHTTYLPGPRASIQKPGARFRDSLSNNN
nr:maleidride dimerizing cylcase [Wicklowia aquatica]